MGCFIHQRHTAGVSQLLKQRLGRHSTKTVAASGPHRIKESIAEVERHALSPDGCEGKHRRIEVRMTVHLPCGNGVIRRAEESFHSLPGHPVVSKILLDNRYADAGVPVE